ncbi:MAG: hypothetical protein ABI461_03615 [Polyangiaceae bacterium]
MPRAQGALFVFCLTVAAVSLACGGDASPAHDGSSATASSAPSSGNSGGSGSGDVRDVRAIHRSRCGNCHVRVEPGERTRAELESAFARHRKRVKMSDEEWARMVDYLASDKPAEK